MTVRIGDRTYTREELSRGIELPVGDNDVDSWNRWSVVSFDATAGSEYRIAVDGAFGAAGAVILSYALSPSNDDFARARPLDASGTATASNLNATAEVLEPLHADVRGGRSIWFTWTAGADGTATVDTFGSDFDTSLGKLAENAANSHGGILNVDTGLTFKRQGFLKIKSDY